MTALRTLALTCCIAVLSTGCSPEPSAKPATATKIATPAGSAGDAFHKLSFDDALKKAKAENKLVMVDFYADWCGPCKHLDRTTWTDPDVQKWLSDKTIAIKIDIDEQKKLAEKYNIESIPALVFFRGDGTEVERAVGYRDPKQFLKFVEKLSAAQ